MQSLIWKYGLQIRHLSHFLTLLLCLIAARSNAEGVFLVTPTAKGHIAARNWKEIRDDRIVKQNLDYSCGAASLATVLREFYGLAVSEKEILDHMEQDGLASFLDLAKVARLYGFKAQGLALDFSKLKTLKVPAIAYVRHRGDDHFTVIRGVSKKEGRVWLGDSLWGNRQFSEHQFRHIWETRADEAMKGKILVILPGKNMEKSPDYTFVGQPKKNSVAVDLLETRIFP